ncbi:translesion DNA synthesis-associated protein ImuA [Massilia sp. CCM 8734]|uniref:translesion DNA synthesis-associated protein ImuA n=1 Tax=Massilia sp. CCM 8734 TaxID=2609283 RepID=UPI001422250A|nr:translesion DNA synthesis-associated protein ImuA [Massilia sp. CCM 8734]NHZ99110.1 translesion DNA synthesis-associated protein ImuA [Massilia sp. CCM 8734]
MLCPPLIPAQGASGVIDLAQLPDIWRASELAVSRAVTISSAHVMLDAELPNRGWPRSCLTELLLQAGGIGELQLLKPVLQMLSATRRIALVQPPYIPHAMAFQTWGIETSRLLWMRAASTGDALWTTEQILKNGSCGAVLLWQNNIRPESLRRLNLAAQSGDTCFWLLRPLVGAAEASPAPLRLGLRPANGGVSISIIKRRGPASAEAFFVPLPDMPVRRHQPEHDHAVSDQPVPAVVALRIPAPLLV